MEPGDLGQVNLVLSKAFSKARIQNGYLESHVPLCRVGFLRMYLEGNPQGCYVAEVPGRIVGYVFSRRWGSVGWFGPLSVDPELAGQGIGRLLVGEVVNHLIEADVRTVGLETNPRSRYNIGFYSKLEFEPSQLIVDVARELSDRWEELPAGYQALRLGRASEKEIPHLLATLGHLAEGVCPGLDYRAEAELIINHSYGDALILFDSGEPVGAALAHTEPYTETEERALLKVFTLVMAPTRPLEDLGTLVSALEHWAREEFLSGLSLRVSTRFGRAFRFLLESGFKVAHTDLRMVLRGYEERDDPESIHFSKWE
jgi:ribosomal protein S18 acetylase RimI-like enzyme